MCLGMNNFTAGQITFLFSGVLFLISADMNSYRLVGRNTLHSWRTIYTTVIEYSFREQLLQVCLEKYSEYLDRSIVVHFSKREYSTFLQKGLFYIFCQNSYSGFPQLLNRRIILNLCTERFFLISLRKNYFQFPQGISVFNVFKK
jgi:hypothetical protein